MGRDEDSMGSTREGPGLKVQFCGVKWKQKGPGKLNKACRDVPAIPRKGWVESAVGCEWKLVRVALLSLTPPQPSWLYSTAPEHVSG